MEEDIKIKLEAFELKKQQGCKVLECGVVNNNIILRQENIKLKRKNKELEKMVELMAEYISIEKYGDIERSKSVTHYFKKKASEENK